MNAATETDLFALNQFTRLVAGLTAVFAFAIGLAWLAQRPEFALTAVVVETPVAHVTEAQVRLVAERNIEGTFFTVDLDAVRAGLEKLPWVAEARVTRRWPDTLVVALVEHEPVARWNDQALISTKGEVFAAATGAPLPRLYGPEGLHDEVVATYRRLAAALAPIGLLPVRLELSARHAWTAVLDNGITLVIGRHYEDAQIARFVALYPRLFASPAGSDTPAPLPERIDLRYADGFAIRMPVNQRPAGLVAQPGASPRMPTP